MKVEHVEVLAEEPSMEAALQRVLPIILDSITFKVHPHRGKDHLLRALDAKLRGYANWLPDSYRVLVIVDRDDDDCRELKARLEEIASNAGLVTKSTVSSRQYQLLNRIAVEELESWYFGDWEAVKSAYPRVNATIASQAKYRYPDAIAGGTWEAFERVLKRAGYFKTGLRKIEAARAVAEHMDPNRNRSPSFQILRAALAQF